MKRKGFFPPKDFEEKLDDLVKIYEEQNWDVQGLSKKTLSDELKTYVDARQSEQKMREEFTRIHDGFIEKGRTTWDLFFKALSVADGLARGNKALEERLDALHRTFKRETPPTEPIEEEKV